MINISICDDDPKELQTLTCLFNKYREAKPSPIHLNFFQNGFSLLDAMDDILVHLNQKDNAGFIIYNSSKQYTRILFSQLVYTEAMCFMF